MTEETMPSVDAEMLSEGPEQIEPAPSDAACRSGRRWMAFGLIATLALALWMLRGKE